MAPMAPRQRSSHMNQKRRCPGVPKRYSTRSSASVIRPKSIATVVVALVGTAARSSTPSDSLVTSASVRSGSISDTAPTSVDLPTPKPPAMTIFVDAAARCALVVSKSTEGPFDELETLISRRAVGDGGLDADQALLDQVTQQHPGDADRHLGEGRHLGHGTPIADLENLRSGRGEHGCFRTRLKAERGLHGQLDLRGRPACGEGVGPDQSRAVALVLRLGWRRHGAWSGQPPVPTRAWASTVRPTRSTSRAIS